MYSLSFSKDALVGLNKLRKSEPKAFAKAMKLIEELKYNPFVGTGRPERLKGTSVPTWSREITKKHRLVYEIVEDEITIFVLSSYGHYDDK
jgi:toxin YoeB